MAKQTKKTPSKTKSQKTAPKTKSPISVSAKQAPKAYTGTLESMVTELNLMMGDFLNIEDINTSLTGKERMRLIGAGVRNYWFIDKAFDIARENPAFMPAQLSVTDIWNDMHDFEEVRQIVWVLEKFLQAANEVMLLRGDKIFRDALFIYNNLRELTRARVPGAEPLFEALLKFFRRRPRPGETEPTIKELERDFNKLVHGHADGKIVIENETPKKSGGVRKVVDEVYRGKAAVKLTAEAEEEE